jgi:hypothetical protein
MRPIFIEPVINREMGDCALACLVMWTGRSYQEVISVCPPGAHKQGMWNRDVVKAGAALGATFERKRKFNLHEDDGILMLNPVPSKGRPSHTVVLLDGMVLDPYNGRLWLDVDIYLKTERYEIGELLREAEAK